MTDVWWLLVALAVIFAGDALLVGLHHLTIAHPPTRARAVSSDRPAAPARVRPRTPGGRTNQGRPPGARRGPRTGRGVSP